ncbi:hypothetical protein ABZ511_20000, partial [Nocardia gamkensis]|uniref:hypothetical protein n=1 Tax=Nocardia gamkensis TaxID=352869 RepID=UPI0033C52218
MDLTPVPARSKSAQLATEEPPYRLLGTVGPPPSSAREARECGEHAGPVITASSNRLDHTPAFERSETEHAPFAARLAFARPSRRRRRSKRRSRKREP